jgi:hypothetical protein
MLWIEKEKLFSLKICRTNLKEILCAEAHDGDRDKK